MNLVLSFIIFFPYLGECFSPWKRIFISSRHHWITSKYHRNVHTSSVYKQGFHSQLHGHQISALFDISSSNCLDDKVFSSWISNIERKKMELMELRDMKSIQDEYTNILQQFGSKYLDPIQMCAFDILQTAISDSLWVMLRERSSISDVVIFLDQIHIQVINFLRTDLMQETLGKGMAYQLCNLFRNMYLKLSNKLCSTFDESESTTDLRVRSWMASVYAYFQIKVPGFVSSSAVQEADFISAYSYDAFLRDLAIEFSPVHNLSTCCTEVILPGCIGVDESAFSSCVSPSVDVDIEVEVVTDTNKDMTTGLRSPDPLSIPGWLAANKLVRLIRYIHPSVPISSLESRVSRIFQKRLSEALRENCREISRSENENDQPSQKECCVRMLNIGHNLQMGIFTLWHIRHNIIGDAVLDVEGRETDARRKQFLLPVTLLTFNDTLNSIPENQRDVLRARFSHASMPDVQRSLICLASAVRETASEVFRSLVTYDSNALDWPEDRDYVFGIVLRNFLDASLHCKACLFDEKQFYSQLVAIAALEEAMGVREPRKVCKEAWQKALHNSITSYNSSNFESSRMRLALVEQGLSLILRLEPDSAALAKVDAVESFIRFILNKSKNHGEINPVVPSSQADLKSIYIAAKVFGLSETVVNQTFIRLATAACDKVLGSLLIKADLSKEVFSQSLSFSTSYVSDLSLKLHLPIDAIFTRIDYIAAVVVQSMLEKALEEFRSQRAAAAHALLLRSLDVLGHPLVHCGARDSRAHDFAIFMLSCKLSTGNGVNELLRFLDEGKKLLQKQVQIGESTELIQKIEAIKTALVSRTFEMLRF